MQGRAEGSRGWEAAWSLQSRRWYFQDRSTGVSSWSRPPGCTIELPKAPPPNAPSEAEIPKDLPPGWQAEWDPAHKKIYYFNRERGERLWQPPPKVTNASGVGQASAEGGLLESKSNQAAPSSPPSRTVAGQPVTVVAQDAVVGGILLPRGGGHGRGQSRGPSGWDAVDFKRRVDEARATSNRQDLKKVLREVAEHNYALRSSWPVPRTSLVTSDQCLRHRVTGTGRDPQITFSFKSTADALLYFGRKLGPGKVCGLNFANGVQVGGGYKTGAVAQEEDLCRRIPCLYSSLYKAAQEHCYPFGPSTYVSLQQPGRYSDVLWTPDVTVARLGEKDGFELLPREQQATVSLVAAAAPNLRFADPRNPEVFIKELMYTAVQTILLAPRVKQPEISVLVLGAWGCGAFGGDPDQICELFCEALVKAQLGRLYKEVHFAIPKFSEEDRNAEKFMEVLRHKGIAFTETSLRRE